jgi:hypothetical protein
MAFGTTGDLAILPALGYVQPFDRSRDAFVAIEVGVGYVLHGAVAHEMGVVRDERFGRTYGAETVALINGEVELAVPGSSRGHGGSVGLRLFQSFFLGRHALALTGSVAPRWDASSDGTGVLWSAGLGYAVVRPPGVIPSWWKDVGTGCPAGAPSRHCAC